LNDNDLFRLGYICGWVNGWGWASAPWVAKKIKRLIYLHRTNELLNAFDGSEPEWLLRQWERFLLEESDINFRFGGK